MNAALALPHADKPFVVHRIVQWGDTDAANIVYTARYADYLIESVEAWWRDRFQMSWFEQFNDLKFGSPFVNVTLDFMKSVTPRISLDVCVTVVRVGNSAVTFRAEARGHETGDLHFIGRTTCVFTNEGATASARIPDRFRDVLLHELQFGEAAEAAYAAQAKPKPTSNPQK